MAVRAFELNESEPTRLTVVDGTPQRRQDLRRTRQQWLVIGFVAMAVPFGLALFVVGVLS